jgi:outer membrane protein assembly factor BamB
VKAACNEITSAVTAGDLIYLPTDGGVRKLDGAANNVRPGASQTAVIPTIWTSAKLNFGAASPLVDAGHVYTVNRAGVLNCGDATSGTILWQLRLKGAIWGSPAIAGNHMYFVNKDGTGLVVRLPPKDRDSIEEDPKELSAKAHESGELVGEGAIDEPVLASPAIADGALYIRSDRHLWKIAAHGRH